MSNASIVVAFVLATLLLVWLALPILRGYYHSPTVTPVEQQRIRLQRYYTRVLQNLHDIDEDFATGKLDADQHRHLREQWIQRGIQALKALDALETDHLLAEEPIGDDALDQAIERKIEAAVLSVSASEREG
jgi:aminoglycoside phosphotransferase (APT) family kinase protein